MFSSPPYWHDHDCRNSWKVFEDREKVLERVFEVDCRAPSEEAIFSDNTAAVQIATSPELKTKSRHYAMRLWRVRDNAEKLVWCPTGMMKADAMTKLAISPAQRRLLFYNVANTSRSSKKGDDVEPVSEEEEETENVVGYLLLNNEKYAVTFLS